MPPAKSLFIIFIITLLVFHEDLGRAESDDKGGNGKIRVSTLRTVDGISHLPNSCDDAREWFDEGLRLSNNSDQEAYYYRRAIELCPEFVAAYARLGEVYKNQKKYTLSIEAFEQARIQALASNHFASTAGSRALFLESAISLGEIYKIQGKYERAAEEFSKALQLDPESLAAQNQQQYIYKRMHRYDNVLSPNNRLLANGIFTRIPGMTLPEKTYQFDTLYSFWDQTAPLTPDMFEDERIQVAIPPSERKSDVKVGILSMRYGLTNDLTIGLIPKYFWRSLEIRQGAFRVVEEPSFEGFGDTELLIKYHIWGERNRHLSLYSSFTLPTGNEVEVIGDEPLIRTGMDLNRNPITEVLQFKRYVPLGSESFDVTPGIAFTLGLDPLILLANMQYRITDGKQIGDEFQFNAAANYRVNRAVNALMELNYRWQDDVIRNQQVITFALRPNFIGRERTPAGALVLDTPYTELGGHMLYLSPGLQLTVAQGVRFECGMQIPIIRQDAGWSTDIVYQLGLTFMNF